MMATNPVNGTIAENSLTSDGVKARIWFALVPASLPYDALLVPSTWAKCAKVSTHDLVRCRASDGSYDVLLVATMRATGGVLMEFFAGRPPVGSAAT